MSFESEDKGSSQPSATPDAILDQFEELVDGYSKLSPEVQQRIDALVEREDMRKLLRDVGSLFNKRPLLRENPKGALLYDFHLGQEPEAHTSVYRPGGRGGFFNDLLKGLTDMNSTDGASFGPHTGALRPLSPPMERLAETDMPSDEAKRDAETNPETDR